MKVYVLTITYPDIPRRQPTMANCAYPLAILLPFIVVAAHIIGTTTFSTDSQNNAICSPCRQHATSSSPRRRPEPAVLEELMKAGSAAKDFVQRLEHLAKMLRLFGYERMASAVPLLSDSWMLVMFPGPITVFAVPDDAFDFEAACPGCPLRPLVIKQLALGLYSFSKLSSWPSMRLRTPAFGFCMS